MSHLRNPRLTLTRVMMLIATLAALGGESFITGQSGNPQPTSSAMDERLTSVPAWAKSSVWYQMMPQLFRNGDPANDPTVDDLDGTWPFEKQTLWQLTPWTSDPYSLRPWEKANGKSFFHNAHLRRWGGDIQGVLDKLDYLRELGVNAIYFTPVFEAPAYHMYDTVMYHHIHHNFGPDPKGDLALYRAEKPGDPITWKWTAADKLFLKLLREAHSRNIRIVVDGVFHYVGRNFWDERMKDTKPTWKSDFHKHIEAVAKRWGDPNGDGDPSDGLDGWRLDMAAELNKDFLRNMRRWVRNINPNALIIGEMWLDSYKMINSSAWYKGDLLDGEMNYKFGDTMIRGLVDKENQLLPSEIEIMLAEVRNVYPQEHHKASWNLIDSHDTARLMEIITNGDHNTYNHPWVVESQWPYSFAVARNHPYRHGAGRARNKIPTDVDRRVMKAILTFQFTYLGSPYVYFGNESGMNFGSRNPMVWSDLKYEPQHPYGPEAAVDVKMNPEIFELYKSVIALRHSNKCLQQGSYKTVLIDDERKLFAFERANDTSDRIRVVVNLSDRDQQINAVRGFLPPLDPYKIPNGMEPMEWELIFGDKGDRDIIPAKTARVYRFLYKAVNRSGM